MSPISLWLPEILSRATYRDAFGSASRSPAAEPPSPSYSVSVQWNLLSKPSVILSIGSGTENSGWPDSVGHVVDVFGGRRQHLLRQLGLELVEARLFGLIAVGFAGEIDEFGGDEALTQQQCRRAAGDE